MFLGAAASLLETMLLMVNKPAKAYKHPAMRSRARISISFQIPRTSEASDECLHHDFASRLGLGHTIIIVDAYLFRP